MLILQSDVAEASQETVAAGGGAEAAPVPGSIPWEGSVAQCSPARWLAVLGGTGDRGGGSITLAP